MKTKCTIEIFPLSSGGSLFLRGKWVCGSWLSRRKERPEGEIDKGMEENMVEGEKEQRFEL